jgi:hypothetical protein
VTDLETIGLAYGLLWLAPDKDERVALARKVLMERLDRDSKIRGVHAAQDALAARLQ